LIPPSGREQAPPKYRIVAPAFINLFNTFINFLSKVRVRSIAAPTYPAYRQDLALEIVDLLF